MAKPIKVVQNPDEVVPHEVLAKAITDISESMRKLFNGRLARRTIVLLIHDSSKVPMRDIEYVLNSMEQLEANYLKKALVPSQPSSIHRC
jgi:3-dehydroquinate dehydratase